jgi:outer membrane protein TolC
VIAPGLPSELLARRPDIFSAENSLAAAHADVAAARAALFPSMTLTASGGAQNPAMQAAVITLEGTGPSLIFGAAIVQSIFDAGRRRAVRDEATAKEQELLATYRSSILSALVDVETALAAVRHLELQQPAQAEYLLQSERASEGARLRFREGATDYLTLFEAQRLYYTARDQFSQYKLARLQAIIGLSRALGGGWQSPTSESPPP